MRSWAGVLFMLGCVGLIPPATPVGIVMMIFGGTLWLLCPVVQINNDHMIAETERTGNGCGWFLLTFIVGAVVLGIAGALAVGGIEAMSEGGW